MRESTGRIRRATCVPLWVKLTGQRADVAGLAAAAHEGGPDAAIVMGRFHALGRDDAGLRALAESVRELQAYPVRQGRDARALIGEAADRLQGYAEQPSRPNHWKHSVPPGARD